MSVKIKTSLNRLNESVYKLEDALATKTQQIKSSSVQRAGAGTPQSDLFASPSGTGGALNVRLLATRLDSAIAQVETILKEGRG